MHILIVSQYFWPENMRINDLVEGLIAKGHAVTVLTGVPNYPEGTIFADYKNNKSAYDSYKEAKIIRVPMFVRGRGKHSLSLILNYCSFVLSASTIGLFKLRRQNVNALFVYAVSPILAAIPAVLIGRVKKAPVLLWVLDLWPETLSAVGVVHNQRLLNAVGKVVSWIYNRADYILFQSRSFKASIMKYCTKPIADERLVYFPNWCEDSIADQQSLTQHPLLKRDNNYFTIMFAGTVAESQDFPAIVDALERLKQQQNIRLIVVGDWAMHEWLTKEIKQRQLNNITLLGRHPISDIPAFFACADALLVSLKQNDIFSKTIPGKLQAYLAAGIPIIGMIDGEAADIINESKSGLVGPAGDAAALAQNIARLSLTPTAELTAMGQNGILYYQQHFQAHQLFDKLESLFETASRRLGH